MDVYSYLMRGTVMALMVWGENCQNLPSCYTYSHSCHRDRLLSFARSWTYCNICFFHFWHVIPMCVLRLVGVTFAIVLPFTVIFRMGRCHLLGDTFVTVLLSSRSLKNRPFSVATCSCATPACPSIITPIQQALLIIINVTSTLWITEGPARTLPVSHHP